MRKPGRKPIFAIMSSLLIITNTMKVEGNGEVQPSEKDYCSISDFEDFHYYLFCNTNIGTTAGVNPTVNAFIGSEAETSEAGIELYQKFMEPFRADYQGRYMELCDISSDARLVITEEDEEGNISPDKWRFFNGEIEKGQQKIGANRFPDSPFRIIKSGDTYIVVDEETVDEKADKFEDKTGYRCVEFNEQGNLAVGRKYDSLHDMWEMTICDLESAEVLLTIYQGDKLGYAYQIQGDKESGKVVYQIGYRDFYEYTYPSGEIRYLGKDMYYPCYSPDGKYIAYSSPDGEACYDLDEKESGEVLRILPGIYILEMETGKIAYIKQDVYDLDWADRLDSRGFQWVEKDSFDQIMEKRK